MTTVRQVMAAASRLGTRSSAGRFAEDVGKSTAKNRMTLASAGLAFHGFLAIFPALIAAVGLARLVGLSPHALTAVIHDLGVLLPHSVASILVDALQSTGSRRADLIAVIVGLLVAIWSSIEAISALQQALDVAFDVPKPHGFLVRRVRAIPLLGVTIVLAGAAVALLVFGPAIERLIAVDLPVGLHGLLDVLSWVVRIAGALIAITLLLSLYYGSATGRSWRDWRALSPGGGLATLGWVVASLGYSLYLTHSAGESVTYGPLAGVAVLLLWLYLTFVMILLGAEVDHALDDLHNSHAPEPLGPSES